MRLIKRFAEIDGIGRNGFRNGWEWAEILWEYVKVVRNPLGICKSSQKSFGSGPERPDSDGLLRSPMGSMQKWSEFLYEWSGMVRIPSGASEIGQNSVRCVQDW